RAVVEHVLLCLTPEPRRVRTEEEEAIPHDGAADRAAHLVLKILVLRVLNVADRAFVGRVEIEPLRRACAERAPQEEVVTLAAQHVAAALGHGADHTAEGAAVLRGDAGRL